MAKLPKYIYMKVSVEDGLTVCLDPVEPEEVAAEVRPVKRGEWVKNEDKVGWHCSACKVDNNFAYSWNSETGKNEFQDNYCPHCGADMRPKPPEREADEEDEP